MSTYDDASLILIPSGVKDGKVYSAKPVPTFGAELVTNGSITGGSTGWTLETGWSYSANALHFDGLSNIKGAIPTITALSVGSRYNVKFTISNVSTFARILVSDISSANEYVSSTDYPDGLYSLDFTASATDLSFYSFSASGAFSMDDISVKEIIGSGDFTFTRASEATRLVDGVVTKVRTNSLLQSNDFDTTWANTNTTETGGQADKDGGTDAWLIDKSAASATIQQTGLSISGVHTFSIYAKAGTLGWIKITSQSGNVKLNVNLSTGAVGTTGNLVIDTKVTNEGNGWYRCEMAVDATSTAVYIFPANGNDDTSATSGNILIQNAQLEYGTVATDYIATTTVAVSEGPVANMPRLNSVAGGCPSLLLEPQRTNISPYSEYFGSWSSIGNETITNNYGISPDGFTNATRFKALSTGRGGVYVGITVSNVTTHTISFYAKSLSGAQKLRIGADAGCINPQGAETFDVTDEWARFETQVTSNTTYWNIYFDNVESGTACTGTYLTCDMLVYGFQCEVGSYATSYIPTYGTAATRVWDALSVTGVQTNNLLGSNQGSFVFHYKPYNAYTGSFGKIYDFRIDSNNRMSNYFSNGTLRLFSNTAGVTNFNQPTVLDGTSEFKIGVGFDTNSTLVYINGVLTYTLNGCSLAFTDFEISPPTNGSKLSQCSWYSTKLLGSELSTLTTL